MKRLTRKVKQWDRLNTVLSIHFMRKAVIGIKLPKAGLKPDGLLKLTLKALSKKIPSYTLK